MPEPVGRSPRRRTRSVAIAAACVAAVGGTPAGALAAAPAGSSGSSSTTLTSCTFDQLNAAVQRGGTINLECSTTVPPVATKITFTAPIVASSGTVSISATPGQSISFDGGGKVQLFKVTGGSLSLTGVKLSGGLAKGAAGDDGSAGVDGSQGDPGTDAESDGATGGNGDTGGNGGTATIGAAGGNAMGGAMYIGAGATVTLNKVTFTQDQAIGGAGGKGGSGGAGGGGGGGGMGGSAYDDPCSAGGNGGDGGTGGHGGDGAIGGAGGNGLGGAIYNAGTLSITGSKFSGGVFAQGGKGGAGGAGGLGGAAGFPGFGGVGGSGNESCGDKWARGGDTGDSGSIGSAGEAAPGGQGGQAKGGAIDNIGSLTLSKTTFAGTFAEGGAGGAGGAGGEGAFGNGGPSATATGNPATDCVYNPPYGGNFNWDYGGEGNPGGNGTAGPDGLPGTGGGAGGPGGTAQAGAVASTKTITADSGSTASGAIAVGGAGGSGGAGGKGGAGGGGSWGGNAEPAKDVQGAVSGNGGAGGDAGNGGNGGGGAVGGAATGGVLGDTTTADGPGGAGGKGGGAGWAGCGGLGGTDQSGSAGDNGATGQSGTAGASQPSATMAPILTATSPSSPGSKTSVVIYGYATTGSTVSIYTESGCGGTPAVTGKAADLETKGLTVTVAADHTTDFYANATDALGTSDCSTDPLEYQEQTAPLPDTTITSGPAANSTTASPTPSFGFTSTASGAKFYCQVDSAVLVSCTSPFTTPSLGNGKHTFRVYSVDAFGNTDPTPASRTFTVTTLTPPKAKSAPKISGKAVTGKTLHASRGTFTGSSPLTYSYRWSRCNAAGKSCKKIAHATKPSYQLPRSAAKHRLRVTVTAKNAAGSASATSRPTAKVRT